MNGAPVRVRPGKYDVLEGHFKALRHGHVVLHSRLNVEGIVSGQTEHRKKKNGLRLSGMRTRVLNKRNYGHGVEAARRSDGVDRNNGKIFTVLVLNYEGLQHGHGAAAFREQAEGL